MKVFLQRNFNILQSPCHCPRSLLGWKTTSELEAGKKTILISSLEYP